ncbi:MAG: cytochrome c5 family protein [Oceanospirillaceae bacterium]|nr:cytochrome c5 family protein [Oceanospirillaceae bacterium]
MKKALLALTAAAMLTPAAAMAERDGATVYNTKCLACHMSGVAGAPKVGDAAAWAERMAPGMDAVLASAKKGKGAMPPMGTCMDCSDAELTAAIQYMVDNSK